MEEGYDAFLPSHYETESNGLLGVFVSQSKHSRLLIRSCELTQLDGREKNDPKVASNEKRDSISKNLI